MGIYIFEFLLIYLNDLKLAIKKYHLFLQLITINSDSNFYDDDVGGQFQLQGVQLVVNFMTHDTNFNKNAFIDWSKVFIMPKHVFYDLSYGTTMSNTIKETTINGFKNYKNELKNL